MAAEKCPFCGRDFSFLDSNGKLAKYRVKCLNCMVSTGWHDTKVKAWEAWNNRVANAEVNLLISDDTFVLKSLAYHRNPYTGYCAAQQVFGGMMQRIHERVFYEARNEIE